MTLPEIHIINKTGRNIIFLPQKYDFFNISEQGAIFLRTISDTQSYEMALEVSGLCKSDADEILTIISESDKNVNNLKKQENENYNLNRLVLNVSNDCNLRCRYCYANGGDYKGKRELMDSDSAKAIGSSPMSVGDFN